MPSKKKKRDEVQIQHRMTRLPLGEVPKLYPDLRAEKENMHFSSSDDSPEKKFPYHLSPKVPKKNNSPSDQESIPKVENVTRQRSGIQQQRQKNTFQDNDIQTIHRESSYNENSDGDVEKDSSIDTRHSHKPKPNRFLLEKEKYSTDTVQASDSGFCSSFRNISILAVIIISSIYFFFYYFFPVSTTLGKNDALSAVTIVGSLKSEFKDLPSFTFRIIGSALKKVLVDKPESPAMILLLATNGTKTICNDFASRLIKLLSVPACTTEISGENYKQVNVNKAKMEIDQVIKKALNVNQLGSVLINDLDQIPGQAALILHKYFDHEHAPFKKAVFVMTANYNKPIDSISDSKVWDKAANDHLHSVWSDTGIDQISALLSRLTVSVAVITSSSLHIL